MRSRTSFCSRPLLIAAQLHNPQAPAPAAAGMVYFLAMLTHYLVYTAGVPALRTLAYFLGLGATLVALSTLA
jgi:uncharacterized MAPEG superfamily protein